MNIALYVIAGLMVADALSYVAMIGRPHKHTAAGAAVELIVTGLAVTLLVIAAGHLR